MEKLSKSVQQQLLAELFETWKERGGELYYCWAEMTFNRMFQQGIVDEFVPGVARAFRENGYSKVIVRH